MTDRRSQIADTGVRILASRGVRALTHLAIDRELGLAQGSTSYYARTRRDLLALIIQRLAERTNDELAAQVVPDELTPQSVASMIVAGLDATMQRADDHRARLILLLECHNDPELSAALVTRPQVRAGFTETATFLLERLGIDQPAERARDLVGLLDSLLMQRVIRTAPIDEEAVVRSYLVGLIHGERDGVNEEEPQQSSNTIA